MSPWQSPREADRQGGHGGGLPPHRGVYGARGGAVPAAGQAGARGQEAGVPGHRRPLAAAGSQDQVSPPFHPALAVGILAFPNASLPTALATFRYPDYEFISDNSISWSAGLHNRYTENSLRGVILDIHFLSQTDFLVCTFSSQVSSPPGRATCDNQVRVRRVGLNVGATSVFFFFVDSLRKKKNNFAPLSCLIPRNGNCSLLAFHCTAECKSQSTQSLKVNAYKMVYF